MMKKVGFISELEKKISSFKAVTEIRETGRILDVGDGVARVDGLKDVALGELVLFRNKIPGVTFNLEEFLVGCIVLGDFTVLKESDTVIATGDILKIPVGESLIGRVVDPLCYPLDGKGKVLPSEFYPIEKIAPGVTLREPVNTPVQTGIKAIDSMIPIGRGQRELIIGDRGTGKTTLAIDTIINQKDKNLICIYVAIGQRASRVARVVDVLEKFGALSHSIVVAANASDPASLQYLAPYAGCSIGEYFLDQGKDVLVVFDDLTKHAWAYREISLVLRRPAGREAYPGDVFYLHSRLLERACKLSKKYGGGSLTALPIIETQAGDISAYIPTNVISITDGQIYLESDLFHAGIRPAINVGLSVSRVGSAAQTKAMKQVAGKLKLELAQYRELAAFAQFEAELDEKTKKFLDRGARMTQILIQKNNQPLDLAHEVLVLWIGIKGYLDNLPVASISEFESKFLEYVVQKDPQVMADINKNKILEEKDEEILKKIVEEFIKENYDPSTGSGLRL